MAGEIVYVDLNLPSGFPDSRMPRSAQPLGARWQRTALWVGWIGNVVLVIAVIVLGIWVYHLVPKKGTTPAAPGSDGAGSRDIVTPPGRGDPSTATCSARLDRVRSQLCPLAQPGPAGGSGCKLCPTDWRLHGGKCYWVSEDSKTWNESRSDCAARGSQLPVIQEQEELESLQNLTQDPAQLWVGLSRPSPGEAWTWLDGSRLDQSPLPVSGRAEGDNCGAMKGNRICAGSCSAAFQWICQQEAVPL
ncbi:killer cell lectin-like receptor subfamily B member 1B allele A [Carettochelys insculpta]|uniref:killer cell lectin-like receptor subfamily B member 1B allele A n=1 Tax=Carettochelys insculpta TaxID=44489 RepID=UPI003EBC251A